MSQILELVLPDDLYEFLLETAGEVEQKPEDWILTLLKHCLSLNEQSFEQPESIELADGESNKEDSDPLLSLAGTLESDLTNIGEQHDFYIGQTLLTKLRREK